MVFVNGHFSRTLSHLSEPPLGVKLRSLIESLSDGPLKRYFGHILSPENHPFVALNYAYFTDGLFLHVARGKAPQDPCMSSTFPVIRAKPTQSHIRNLILMEEDCQAKVIEHYWGNNLSPYFTNAVTKVSLAHGAFLEHTKIQQESDLAYHIGVLAAQQNEGSRLVSRIFSLGGAVGAAKWKRSCPRRRPSAYWKAWPFPPASKTWISTPSWTIFRPPVKANKSSRLLRIKRPPPFLTAGSWCGKTPKRPMPDSPTKTWNFPGKPEILFQASTPNLRG